MTVLDDEHICFAQLGSFVRRTKAWGVERFKKNKKLNKKQKCWWWHQLFSGFLIVIKTNGRHNILCKKWWVSPPSVGQHGRGKTREKKKRKKRKKKGQRRSQIRKKTRESDILQYRSTDLANKMEWTYFFHGLVCLEGVKVVLTLDGLCRLWLSSVCGRVRDCVWRFLIPCHHYVTTILVAVPFTELVIAELSFFPNLSLSRSVCFLW